MVRALACAALVFTGCALRPRYLEVKTRVGDVSRLRVLDGEGKPVPGARIEIGDRFRFKAVTDASGCFDIPAEEAPQLQAENALVVVVLPRGVRGYRIEAAPGAAAVVAAAETPPSSPPRQPASPQPAEPAPENEQPPPPPPAAAANAVEREEPEAGRPAAEETYRRLHFAYGAGLGGGFARYTNGRHGEGFALGVHLRIGFRFSRSLAISGMIWLDPLFGARGQSVNNGPFSSALVPGGWVGPALSLITDSLTFSLGLLAGGNATLGTGPPAYGFGGVGTMLALEADILPWHGPLGRVGPFVRLGSAAMFDFALASAFEVYVSLNAGVIVELE